MVIRPAGRFLLANNESLRIVGLTVDQLDGRSALESVWGAIHPDGTPWPGDVSSSEPRGPPNDL